MTLTGKLFAVFNFLMVVVFVFLVVAVYATHANWRKKVVELEAKLTDSTKANLALRNSIEQSKNTLALERAAGRFTKAALVTKHDSRNRLLNQRVAANLVLDASENEASAAAQVTTTTFNEIGADDTALRDEIRKNMEARDIRFNVVVQNINKLDSARLQALEMANERLKLLDQYSKVKSVLDKQEGLTIYTDQRRAPPKIPGIITRVSTKGDLVEISLGSDDGLEPGHLLDVVRPSGAQYRFVGRVEVQRTSPRTSVASIVKDYTTEILQPNDRVRPKTVK